MTKLLIALFLFQVSFFSYGLDKKETNESAEEFKESKILQIDPVDIPNELHVIDDQITQNVVDVIIITGKHTVAYAQKREEGYNKNFKNFYGIKVSIYPIKEEPNVFVLKLFYYNWTTNKYDRTLTKKISKYNVLNELRMALYELFLGETFVRENRDTIEKKNFDRIQAVRKMIEDQNNKDKKKLAMKKKQEQKAEEIAKEKKESEEKLKREEKKKKQNNKDDSEPVEMDNAEKEKTKSNDVNNEVQTDPVDIADKEKSADSKSNKKNQKKKEKSDVINEGSNEVAGIPPEIGEGSSVPKEITFKFFTGLKMETVSTTGILNVKTNLRYLNLGANYTAEYKISRPWGYTLQMSAGIPIKKDNYQISVARSLEAGVFKNIFSGFRINGGMEYSSLPFVNLPTPGEGLKVIQNDILYAKLGIDYNLKINEKSIGAGIEISESLLQKSSVNKSIQTKRSSFFVKSDITDQHGVLLSFFKTQIEGQFTGNSSGGSVLYTYKFGN